MRSANTETYRRNVALLSSAAGTLDDQHNNDNLSQTERALKKYEFFQ